jgi:hypothetical protein
MEANVTDRDDVKDLNKYFENTVADVHGDHRDADLYVSGLLDEGEDEEYAKAIVEQFDYIEYADDEGDNAFEGIVDNSTSHYFHVTGADRVADLEEALDDEDWRGDIEEVTDIVGGLTDATHYAVDADGGELWVDGFDLEAARAEGFEVESIKFVPEYDCQRVFFIDTRE